MSKVYLPEDVMLNVLARLPVRTLRKLRCVSKSWADLIDNPEFINYHLNLSLTDSESHKLIFEKKSLTSVDESSPISFKLLPGYFKSSLQNSQNFDEPVELYCPEPPLLYFEKAKRLVGSSRGLVCIGYDKDGVCLWNPWTGKYKELPRLQREIFPKGANLICTNYGFGYDDIHDDYKVVRFVQVRTETSQNFCNQVMFYSLKSNGWTFIENLPHATSTYEGACGVFLNHTLHWILRRQEYISHWILRRQDSIPAGSFILAINVRTKRRQFLLLPDEPIRDPILGVSDGTLCVSMGDAVCFKIWLMKDYGIKDSWTKLTLVIGLSCSAASLIRYSESEKQLIFCTNGCILNWYDLEKKISNKKKIYLLGNIFHTVESLVPPSSVD